MATEVGALPDDALAAVFRALPPRSLAVARCVCKPWRDVVDARALLLRHLHRLPRTVRGVFINYREHDHPHHFARPRSPSSSTTIPRVDGALSFLPKDHHDRKLSVLDHCNGLLLCGDEAGLGGLCVCNPATRRWTVLPRWWLFADDKRRQPYAGAYLAFDPAESPHYQVILVAAVPQAAWSPMEDYSWTGAEVRRRARLPDEKEKDAGFCLDWFFSLPEDGTAAAGQWEFQQLQHDVNYDPCRYMGWRGYMEWPPAPWMLRVFSSSTGRWEDRAFDREPGGMPAGTVGKMRSSDLELQLPYYYRRPRHAVYHHGLLYVDCHGSFVARFSLSKNTYQIIETPVYVNECTQPYVSKYINPYLGKLHNGVCFGMVHYQLKIWILNESCSQMEWALKYETLVAYSCRRHNGSWTIEENVGIQDIDHDVESILEEENSEIQDTDHDLESLSEEENSEIQDSDYDVESLSEEKNSEIQDTDHDVESLSEEENSEIQDTDHAVESLSEEENIEIQDTHHDVESLPEEENIEIQDTDYYFEALPEEENIGIEDTDQVVEYLSKEGHEWDSDNDDTFTMNTESPKYFHDDDHINIIGFHPYKEVVFMVREFQVVAYHLNSTTIQYLGNSRPKYCHHDEFCNPVYKSFIYIPCMIGDLLHGDQCGGQSSSE